MTPHASTDARARSSLARGGVHTARGAFLANVAANPAGVVADLNDELFEYLARVGLFVTITVGSYRPGGGVVDVCNAGHSPVLIVNDGTATPVNATTAPLGVAPQLRGRNLRRPLRAGDLIAIGSDGMVEQQRLDGRMFDEVAGYAGGMPADDDRTLVLLRPHAESGTTRGGTT